MKKKKIRKWISDELNWRLTQLTIWIVGLLIAGGGLFIGRQVINDIFQAEKFKLPNNNCISYDRSTTTPNISWGACDNGSRCTTYFGKATTSMVCQDYSE